MAVYEAVVDFLGAPPAGYEIVVWIFCGFVLLFLLCNVFSILGSLFRFLSGR